MSGSFSLHLLSMHIEKKTYKLMDDPSMSSNSEFPLIISPWLDVAVDLLHH